MFEEKVSDRIEGANADHDGLSNALLNSAREVCGETTGKRQRDRKTWWWNEEVQLAVREKKLAFKRWQSERTKEKVEGPIWGVTEQIVEQTLKSMKVL